MDDTFVSTHGTSAAQKLVANVLDQHDVTLTNSATIARQIATGDLMDLTPLIAETGLDIPSHRRIGIGDKTFAITHSVDALVLARPLLQQDADTKPETLDQLIGLLGSGAAGLVIGVDETDLFLAIYAAQAGHLPRADTPFDAQSVIRSLAAMDRLLEFAAPQDAAGAASSLDQSPDTYALLPFGSLVDCQRVVASSPLRLIPNGAPISQLTWSGCGLPPRADAEDLAGAYSALTVDALGPEAGPAAVWLLDGFKPDARHAGLLETIAAGVSMAPTDMWSFELVAKLRQEMASQDDTSPIAQRIIDLTT